MQHIGQVWRVRPGKEAEYDKRHARIWPAMEVLLRDLGVRAYHIYRWDEILFSHLECDDFARVVSGCASSELSARWEQWMGDLLEYPDAEANGWPHRLVHVWSLPAGDQSEEG